MRSAPRGRGVPALDLDRIRGEGGAPDQGAGRQLPPKQGRPVPDLATFDRGTSFPARDQELERSKEAHEATRRIRGMLLKTAQGRAAAAPDGAAPLPRAKTARPFGAARTAESATPVRPGPRSARAAARPPAARRPLVSGRLAVPAPAEEAAAAIISRQSTDAAHQRMVAESMVTKRVAQALGEPRETLGHFKPQRGALPPSPPAALTDGDDEEGSEDEDEDEDEEGDEEGGTDEESLEGGSRRHTAPGSARRSRGPSRRALAHQLPRPMHPGLFRREWNGALQYKTFRTRAAATGGGEAEMRRLHEGRSPVRPDHQGADGGSGEARQLLSREELIRLAKEITGVGKEGQTERARTTMPRWAPARTTASQQTARSPRQPFTARGTDPPALDDFRREHSSANKRVQWLLERYTLSKDDRRDLLRRVGEERARQRRERSVVDENAGEAFRMTREQRMARVKEQRRQREAALAEARRRREALQTERANRALRSMQRHELREKEREERLQLQARQGAWLGTVVLMATAARMRRAMVAAKQARALHRMQTRAVRRIQYTWRQHHLRRRRRRARTTLRNLHRFAGVALLQVRLRRKRRAADCMHRFLVAAQSTSVDTHSFRHAVTRFRKVVIMAQRMWRRSRSCLDARLVWLRRRWELEEGRLLSEVRKSAAARARAEAMRGRAGRRGRGTGRRCGQGGEGEGEEEEEEEEVGADLPTLLQPFTGADAAEASRGLWTPLELPALWRRWEEEEMRAAEASEPAPALALPPPPSLEGTTKMQARRLQRTASLLRMLHERSVLSGTEGGVASPPTPSSPSGGGTTSPKHSVVRRVPRHIRFAVLREYLAAQRVGFQRWGRKARSGRTNASGSAGDAGGVGHEHERARARERRHGARRRQRKIQEEQEEGEGGAAKRPAFVLFRITTSAVMAALIREGRQRMVDEGWAERSSSPRGEASPDSDHRDSAPPFPPAAPPARKRAAEGSSLVERHKQRRRRIQERLLEEQRQRQQQQRQQQQQKDEEVRLPEQQQRRRQRRRARQRDRG